MSEYDSRRLRSGVTDDDWIAGQPNARVTLLEYADFQCPYCAMARPVLDGLIAGYPDELRLVFRHFPVSTTHPQAVGAAEAAECAGAQGRFWPMHGLLFDNQDDLSYPNLMALAEELGLDMARFEEDMRAHRFLSEVRRDFRRGIQDGVNGTPTIFIDGRRYDGPRDRDSILLAIHEGTGASAY